VVAKADRMARIAKTHNQVDQEHRHDEKSLKCTGGIATNPTSVAAANVRTRPIPNVSDPRTVSETAADAAKAHYRTYMFVAAILSSAALR
jgi:hypothetical protein